jgi:hypothetical protein
MIYIIRRSSSLAAATLVLCGFVFLALATIPVEARNQRARHQRAKGTAQSPASPDAAPSSGSVSPGGAAATWTGTVNAPNEVDELACVDGTNCDVFTVNLTGNPSDWAGKKAHVALNWNAGDGADFDVVVHKGTSTDSAGRPNGPVVGSSLTASTTPPEAIDIDPNSAGVGTGQFMIHVIFFDGIPLQAYNGSVSSIGGAPTPTPTPSPGTTPTPTPAAAGIPRYFTYTSPPGYGEDSGEPSVGSNWATENNAHGNPAVFANKFINGTNNPIPNGGTATYFGGFATDMLQITFDDCPSPATAFWAKKPLVLAATPHAVGDPILFTDHGYPGAMGPGRTFVLQEESAAGSTTDVTDDDGETFLPSEGAGPPAGFDHETIAAGPYSTSQSIPPSVNPYPPSGPRRAVYYASQNVADARVSRSDDGGITFGPAVPMYTTADCGGLHGHLKVAPDGTVYVPNNACGFPTNDPLGHSDGQQAAIVSTDNGVTWVIKPVPGSDTQSNRDPSIGIATDGTVYMGMQSKDGHARIAFSHNRGDTWSTPVDVGVNTASVSGAPAGGINNIVFPAVVAGDPLRAAFAFYGSTTGGINYHCGVGETASDSSDCAAGPFQGVWYLYIAHTFDGGSTWVTQNITPNDPIQRGGICNGTSATCRNLLDFFDATVDKEGRVLIGGEDGCVGGCVNGGANSYTTKAFLSRQSGGKRMFSAYDPVEPTFPGAPSVNAVSAGGSSVKLTWSEPDNGGSPITAYNVYKGSGVSFPLVATVNVPTYTDPNYSSGQSYRVTAVNKSGAGNTNAEGPYCSDVAPTAGPTETACVLPGIQVLNDVNANGTDNDSAQNTPVDGSVNIKQVYVAEPFIDPGSDQIYFTMQVATSVLGSAPPNSQWFMIWNRQGTDPAHPSDDASYDRMYVAMRTDVNGAPAFEYGKWGVPIDTSGSGVPDPNSNTPKKYGNADGGSYNPLTGLIKVNVSRSKFRAIDSGTGQYNASSFLAGFNARTYFNRPDPGQRSQNNASDITSDSSYAIVGNASCAPAVQLVKAVSRKIHGSLGAFDVMLAPQDSGRGIECRTEAGGNEHVVFTFAVPVTFTGVSVNGTHGAVTTSPAAGSGPVNEVTVNIANAANQQNITIDLLGVSAGAASATISAPLSILVGDTNSDRSVNSGDISQTKSQSGQLVSSEEGRNNFREDINADGDINSGDISVVKSKSGTALP